MVKIPDNLKMSPNINRNFEPTNEQSLVIRRRSILFIFPLPVLISCTTQTEKKETEKLPTQAKAGESARYLLDEQIRRNIKQNQVWKSEDFLNFIELLPPSKVLVLKKALEILPHESTESVLKGKITDNIEIITGICQSQNWFKQCQKPTEFDYHGLVVDLAKSAGARTNQLVNITTFDAEAILLERIQTESETKFVENWMNLTLAERKILLNRVDPQHKLLQHASIAASSAGTVIRTFAAAIKLTGFSGYIAATTALGAATSSAGIAAPFYLYSSMTYTISVLAGPLGWTTGMAMTVFGLAMTGRPQLKKSAAFVLLIHAIKLDALNTPAKSFN